MLSGDELKLYDYVVRHFLASISPDARFQKTTVKFRAAGQVFRARGITVLSAGFTEIMDWVTITDNPL
jgi:DNA topoisomerase-3